jgi:hypothetical protein
MSKQVWGTFSVRDHCDPNAFVAEVMLYDRLVIPVPPNDKERARWLKAAWQPELLDKLLEILGDRAYVVNWDEERQQQWKTRYEAGTDIAQAAPDWAFAATRTELTQGLPRHVTGIQVVTNYTSIDDLDQDLSLRPNAEGEVPLYGGTALAIIGHEFLVPDDPRWRYEDLLRQAVELSSETAYKRKRASFWRWQREFFTDKGITDQSAIRSAVEELEDLLDEEKAITRKKGIRVGTQFAFLAGSIALGMLGGPLTTVAIGGAFVSVGQFVADKLLEDRRDTTDTVVSLLRDTRKHFGWN